ncbi:MAG: hypothetical protein WBF03_04060 [Xanthobacteraceae bacterium]
MLEHDPLAGWRFPRAADEHVVPAIGRDYTDVAPMDGVIVGSGGQRIGVSISVTAVG